MIVLAGFRTRSAAELAQSMLEAGAIPSLIEAVEPSHAYSFDVTGPTRLFVYDADAADAVALLSS